MSFAPLAIEIAFTFAFTVYLLHRYGDWKKHHTLVTVATFVSWYFSFLIICALPLDISSTFYRQCTDEHRSTNDSTNDSSVIAECATPWSAVPTSVLPTFWVIVYWTSQILTWLLLPMMQSYATAGEFTILGRIRTAIIENLIYYGSYLLIFLVCLIYIVAKPGETVDGEKLKVIGITASNTWGLFLLVLLLGYGLVEVPRKFWQNSKPGHRLQQTYFKIAKMSIEKSEATEKYEDALEDIKSAAESIRYNHPFRKYMDVILSHCPEEFRKNLADKDDYVEYNPNPSSSSNEVYTQKTLVRYHKSIMNATRTKHRTDYQWERLIDDAFLLEDLETNRQTAGGEFICSFQREHTDFARRVCSPGIEWYWRCFLQPWALRVAAVTLLVFSVMVVWSEVTFFSTKVTLSFFALFVEAAKSNYFMIELVCLVCLLYISVCAYYTVFHLRVWNFYYIASHHQTDESSLLFSGMLLCRLTPPLCLNFLGLIHLDSHIAANRNLEQTAYTNIMGHMDVIGFISSGFNVYFPIAILILCLATYFKLGTRCLHFIGIEQFFTDDDMTNELVTEGKTLVQRERRKLSRQKEGNQRRREWREKLSDKIGISKNARVSQMLNFARRAGRKDESASDSDRSDLLANEVHSSGYSSSQATNQQPEVPDDSVLRRTYKPLYGKDVASSKSPRNIFDDV